MITCFYWISQVVHYKSVKHQRYFVILRVKCDHFSPLKNTKSNVSRAWSSSFISALFWTLCLWAVRCCVSCFLGCFFSWVSFICFIQSIPDKPCSSPLIQTSSFPLVCDLFHSVHVSPYPLLGEQRTGTLSYNKAPKHKDENEKDNYKEHTYQLLFYSMFSWVYSLCYQVHWRKRKKQPSLRKLFWHLRNPEILWIVWLFIWKTMRSTAKRVVKVTNETHLITVL